MKQPTTPSEPINTPTDVPSANPVVESPGAPERLVAQNTVDTYFDNYMAHPSWGNLAVEQEQHDAYRQLFQDVALRYFDDEQLKTDKYPGQEYNVYLGELASMMSSLSHNAGAYYSQDEVPELFAAISTYVLEDPELQERMQQARQGGQPEQAEAAFKTKIQSSFSLDKEKTLPLVKDTELGWRVADKREYDAEHDFVALEVLRQDNTDKAGWNKYRFRSTTYARSPDDLKTHEVAAGWFASDWDKEPNFWSEQLRNAMHSGLEKLETQLEQTGTKAILVTEGGVAKGTSTEGTDIDSSCVVLGDLSTNFGDAPQVIDAIFSAELSQIPFDLKKGEHVRSIYYDRATGLAFDFNPKTGNFVPFHRYQLFNGKYVFEVRQNEKTIGVTTSKGFVTYKKPADTPSNRSAFIAIDISTGEAQALSAEEIEQYRTLQESQLPMPDASNVDEQWIF